MSDSENGEGAPRAARRQLGPRYESSDRVTLRHDERTLSGWALNVSQGGLRMIVEDPLQVAEVFDVLVGEAPPRPGRIVWVREEADGRIAGIEFLDAVLDGASPSEPPNE